jgi:hypothetical protein
MRAFVALLLAAFVSVMLTQSLAQGAPAAKKTATIPVPTDGNATVAHLVLKATAKKGKKPKRAVKRPKLKVLKAPKGVAVAASFKRDAKNKNRWHATVAITNPVGSPAPRLRTSRSGTADGEGDIVITVIETDTEYIVVIEGVQLDEDVTFAGMPVPPWMEMNCDPPGSAGDVYLIVPGPDGVSPSDFLDYSCLLGTDGPTTAEGFKDLGLQGVVFDLNPFPGNPLEYYVVFDLVNIDGANGVAFQFPGNTVTAQLPPTGTSGVISPQTVTWGNKSQPFVSGRSYQGNARLSSPLKPQEKVLGLYTTTSGPPYSNPYAGLFTP